MHIQELLRASWVGLNLCLGRNSTKFCKVYDVSDVLEFDYACCCDAEKQEIAPTAERSREPHEAGRAGHAGTSPEV